MKQADFVHLHNHSDYSLLDGASSIPGMVQRAVELGMPALALTDHGSMFGAIEFYLEAKKKGIKPILGMEAYVTRGSRRDRARETAHHLVLLARDEVGFRNLMRLSSLAYLEGFYYKPRVDHEILSQYGDGLLALSACPKGEIASDLLDDNEARAAETALTYRDIFGADNFFLEMQNHGLEIEDRIRERVTRLSTRTGIPLVATNDCHYLKHEHADAHDVLLCIQTGKNVDDPKRMRYTTDQVYFKSADEMRTRFADQPDALSNTLAVAERCNVAIHFGKPLLPAFPLPAGAESDEIYLRELAWKELRERFGDISEATKERFDYELDVICRMGFASYFLIVRDFIAFARSKGIGVGPGRGSVAGSLVAFALHITDIDPLKHGLIFERFLNPERVSMPDIDIDFDDLRRGEVIEYVKQKYGEANVTQIITFGTMGAKGVVRDVGRALGLAVSEVDKTAKLVPDGLGMTLERALELSPELKALPQKGPVYERLIRSARVLEGLARHASTHAAGVLITPGPLLDYVPLYRQKDESITTQWDMKAVEKAGLLKMDFLGLRTLSVLEEAVRLIRVHHRREVNLQALELEDAPAYKIFQDADTVAIFQFESNGMRDYLRKLKPTVFEDLVAMNALYRPGPMENIPYFIDCKHGRQVARYEHADLEPILKQTYGVFVYQEQVMEAAHKLAGFSLAQADELRRAMGKKIASEMEAKRLAFVEGCGKRRIPAARAEKIFQTMEKFAGYGFNKSHSAAYALLAYQCAWLKANYPAEFMAATLTSEMSDSARIVTLIEECRRLKLEVLPPDVNRSNWKFSLEDGRVRFGLGAVRNVGQAAVEAMVGARERDGAFAGLFDLAQRLDGRTLNRRALESLVCAGACDELGATREVLFAGAGRALDHAASVLRDKQSGQSSLFGESSGGVAVSEPPLPSAEPWSNRDRSAKEKEVLGFYFSEHPLEQLRAQIERTTTHTIADALAQEDGTEVRIAGVVGEVKPITTRAGKLMAVIQLEDLSGRIECTAFPDLYEGTRALLTGDAIVVASGRIEVRDDRGTKLLLSEVRPFEEAQTVYRQALHVEIRAEEISEERLQGIDETLRSHPGEAEVYLHIVRLDHSRLAMRSRRFRVAEENRVIASLVDRYPFLRVRWGKGGAVTTWLDFEKPVLELEQKIQELKTHAADQGLEAGSELADLERKAEALRREVYEGLTPYQRVQVAKHPARPYTLDYLERCFTDWTELHGDRHFGDDPAIVGGLAMIDGRPAMVIGQQKGRGTKENLIRRFGMPNPEGYRKALRLMQMADRFRVPIVTLVDTPGAYPGLGAEERGQAEAIAVNLREMAKLGVPIVTIVIGEGGSGGALAIAVSDVVLMFENSVYSVISPEGCAAILWRDGKKGPIAADALKLTAKDLLRLGVSDEILPEPLGGNHRDPEAAASTLREAILRHLDALSGVSPDDLIARRLAKFRRLGVYHGDAP